MLNKVMFFLPSLGGGGAERTVIQLANSFAEQGLKFIWVCVMSRVIKPNFCLKSARKFNWWILIAVGWWIASHR